MRWIIDALKWAAVSSIQTAVVNPRAARGMYIILLAFAAIAGGLLMVDPQRFWWAPKVLIGLGVALLVGLVVGFLAVASDMAGGSGRMGGRTGVMLKDLDAIPEDPRRKKKPTVRRRGDTVPEWKVRAKVAAAEALLDFLGDDEAFDKAKLLQRMERTVADVLTAWIETKALPALPARLTPDGRRSAQAELARLVAEEDQSFTRVSVEAVRCLLIDAPEEKEAHRATALVTVRLFDKSKNEIVVVQQFWTFRRDAAKWKADLVCPSEEVDAVCAVKSRLADEPFARFRETCGKDVLAEVAAWSGEA